MNGSTRSVPKSSEDDDSSLRADALGLSESIVMGVAGSGPAYSAAASAAALIAAVGILAPACLLYCGVIMFGVVFAFRHLNRHHVNAGASYSWVTEIFSPAWGFLAGWSSMVSSVLFMVSGTLPAATVTLQIFAPGLVGDQNAVTWTAAAWLVIIGAVVAKGVKLTSYTQIALTVIEVGVLALMIVLAAVKFAHAPAHALSLDWFTGAGFSPSLFASGSLVALFALSGWDVTANLNEETRDGARMVGLGSVSALVLVALLLAGFFAISLMVLSDAEISNAGLDIVSAVADKLLPKPWSSVAAIAVAFSTIGTLETSILQFTRTLYSMGRDKALHPRYAKLHPSYKTPLTATFLIVIGGLALLFFSSWLPGIKVVVQDSINAVGFQIAFYYALAGFACAWRFRRTAANSISDFVFLFAWPLFGAFFCIFLSGLSVASFDLTTTFIGLGGIAIGVAPYLWGRRSQSRSADMAR